MKDYFASTENGRLQPQNTAKQPRTSPFSFRNRLGRQVWNLTALALFHTSPRFLHCWRRVLLRLFGARVGNKVRIQPSVRIWAPWNLDLADYCSIGARVDCYSASKVRIGRHATVSQDCVLCTATHDHRSLDLPLITEEIVVGPYAWICAGVFVMPGVEVGEGQLSVSDQSYSATYHPGKLRGVAPAE